MNNNVMQFLKKSIPKSIEIEDAFTKIKEKRWDNSFVLLAEINVQIGQLFGIINDEKDVLEDGRTFDNVADELCDILLNLSYLIALEQLEFGDDDYSLVIYDSNLEKLPILHGQISEAFLEEEQYRFFKVHNSKSTRDYIKNRILLMIRIIFNYAAKMGIDLDREFDVMCDNTLAFVASKEKDRYLLNSKVPNTAFKDFLGTWGRSVKRLQKARVRSYHGICESIK